MAAEVGGALESVPTQRSLFGPDYVRLLVLALAAVGAHAWLIAHTAVPARDSLGFARYALSLSDPNGDPGTGEPRVRTDVIRGSEQPPAYPAAIWVTEKILRSTVALPTPDRALLATQLTNAAAAVLLVVPMYLTGRMLFSRNVGFAGALLFQVLPVSARVTSDGLSEGVYLLGASTAIALGVRACLRPAIGGFLVCGLAVGATYLARPEGLLVGMAVGLVGCAAAVTRAWPRDAALGRLTALAVGVALVAVPYIVLIGKLTNKSTPDAILKPWETPRIWKGQPSAAAAPTAGPALFGMWWDPKEDEGKSRVVWAARAVWGEVIKAVHYVVGPLALLALVVHRRRLHTGDLGLWVPVALGGLTLVLLFFLAARVGYVSERHTVLFVMLCCLLSAAGIGPLTRGFARLPVLGRIVLWPAAAPATLFAILVASTFPYTFKEMHAHREGHKHAGRWLAAHAGPRDWVQDPLAWAEWYAGRTLYHPPRYAGRPEYVWVVLEKGKGSPHSRLPQWDEARQRAAGYTAVYRWPEDAPEAGPAVEVFRVPFADLVRK